MMDKAGRAPSGQALAVPAEPASGLIAARFDPSRVRLRTSRDLIRIVLGRYARQYRRHDGSWATYDSWAKSAEQIGAELSALDTETATIADVEAIGLNRSWVTEDCDFCGGEQELWFELGDTPDYEARYLQLCAGCIEATAAIAIEARSGEIAKQARSEGRKRGPERHRPK